MKTILLPEDEAKFTKVTYTGWVKEIDSGLKHYKPYKKTPM